MTSRKEHLKTLKRITVRIDEPFVIEFTNSGVSVAEVIANVGAAKIKFNKKGATEVKIKYSFVK